MKKFLFFAVGCTFAVACLTACQQKAEKEAADGAEPQVEATLEDMNAAADSAAQTVQDDVVILKDDNKYRPDTKVERLTILDFNATWCGPCKQFAPVFHDAAKEFGKDMDFVSVDTDVNPETAKAFGISSIPTVVFIYPDGTSKTFVGTDDLMPLSKFTALIKG